jgi:tetraacyldisaccharide 4'-kinase
MTLESRLQRTWLQRDWLAWLLAPLSLIMWSLVRIRRAAYRLGWLRSQRLPVPVIVVGNRIVGGAGKTPTTIALIEYLQSAGWTPGVLSRGYKAQAKGPVLIDNHTAPGLLASQTGDEPLLIWRRTGAPMMVGPDRPRNGLNLLASHPEIDLLVCDDGLQHLPLQRDIEVIVFDERGTGNGWLLPAGPLRESLHTPPTPGLIAPPLVVYNARRSSTPIPGHLAHKRMAPLCLLADWWRSQGTEPAPVLAELEQPVYAVAGIANPSRFFDTLREAGARVTGIPLPDHADLSHASWPEDARNVIVTEKDAIKLRPDDIARARPSCRVWVAPLDFQLDATFWATLDGALAGHRSALFDHRSP